MEVELERTERLNKGYEGTEESRMMKSVQLEGWSYHLLNRKDCKVEQVKGTYKELSIAHIWIKMSLRHPSKEVK